MRTDAREPWPDIAKGLAIAFVVYGHAYRGLRDGGFLADAPGRAIADYVIYTTHMPVFFFITGCFFDGSIAKGVRAFWSSRLSVLAWPYLLWSFLQLQAQLVGDRLALSNGSPEPSRILTILWDPISPFWFLHALIAALLVSTLLRGVSAVVPAALSLVLLVLTSGRPATEAVNDIAYALFYLSCGRLWWSSGLALPAGGWLRLAGLGLLFAALAGLGYRLGVADRLNVPAAIAGLALVFTLANGLSHRGGALATLGTYSMGIFVMHITVLGAARALGLLLFDGSIPLTLVLQVVLGIALPMLVQKAANDLHIAGYLGLRLPGAPRRPAPASA